ATGGGIRLGDQADPPPGEAPGGDREVEQSKTQGQGHQKGPSPSDEAKPAEGTKKAQSGFHPRGKRNEIAQPPSGESQKPPQQAKGEPKNSDEGEAKPSKGGEESKAKPEKRAGQTPKGKKQQATAQGGEGGKSAPNAVGSEQKSGSMGEAGSALRSVVKERFESGLTEISETELMEAVNEISSQKIQRGKLRSLVAARSMNLKMERIEMEGEQRGYRILEHPGSEDGS
ncbi:hypothetical protein, partial [Thioalkalivibrio sp. ALE23]|uniref:hypothetical protein n=1 Tax=Thioalkalivibrio sp. ALE23 TaxID=1265495 RepID=UPI00037DAFC0